MLVENGYKATPAGEHIAAKFVQIQFQQVRNSFPGPTFVMGGLEMNKSAVHIHVS